MSETNVAEQKAALEREREKLMAARALIIDETHWICGTLAGDSNYVEVPPLDPAAVCWCLQGALMKAYDSEVTEVLPAWRRVVAVAEAEYGEDPTVVNDRHGHAAVIKLLDHAIAEADSELAATEIENG